MEVGAKGPQDPTKKLAQWVELLGQPISRKHVFEILVPEPPLRSVTESGKPFLFLHFANAIFIPEVQR